MTPVEIVVAGGPQERDASAHLLTEWGEGLDAAGAFPVGETAALLKECALLIGLDTGTTHLAAAVGTPFVALFAARNIPGQWEPMGLGVVFRRDPPCAACELTVCPVANHPCMENIGVEEVWQAVRALLNGTQLPVHAS